MENTEDLIKLPCNLGMKINEILKKKNNFQPRVDSTGLLSFEYTLKELAEIERLELTNPVKGNLAGIEKLTNLKTLIVTSTKNSYYTRDIASISDRDVLNISNCTNLEVIEIENQTNITYLDFSKLTKLKGVSIKKNRDLEEIYGLENLKSIWKLDFYGNENIIQIPKLNEFINQNQELTDLNLDLLLFTDAIGYDSKNGTMDNDAILKLKELNTKWHEILSSGKSITINNYQMMTMHNTALAAIEKYVPKGSDKYRTILGIELYLSENVVYDNNSLKTDHSHAYECKDSLPTIVSGPIGGANGAYNAFAHNTCVCEGYSRAMQYLLKLKGIKSHNVHCIGEKDTLHMSSDNKKNPYIRYELPKDGYHSIVSIDDMDSLYDDPCWNASNFQQGDRTMPWFLLTKSEISKDHTLSFGEHNIDNNTRMIPHDMLNQMLKGVINNNNDNGVKRR